MTIRDLVRNKEFHGQSESSNSYSSPYHCLKRFSKWAWNLKLAKASTGVTGSETSFRPVNIVRCTGGYLFKHSFILCIETFLYLNISHLRWFSFRTPGLLITTSLFFTPSLMSLKRRRLYSDRKKPHCSSSGKQLRRKFALRTPQQLLRAHKDCGTLAHASRSALSNTSPSSFSLQVAFHSVLSVSTLPQFYLLSPFFQKNSISPHNLRHLSIRPIADSFT